MDNLHKKERGFPKKREKTRRILKMKKTLIIFIILSLAAFSCIGLGDDYKISSKYLTKIGKVVANLPIDGETRGTGLLKVGARNEVHIVGLSIEQTGKEYEVSLYVFDSTNNGDSVNFAIVKGNKVIGIRSNNDNSLPSKIRFTPQKGNRYRILVAFSPRGKRCILFTCVPC